MRLLLVEDDPSISRFLLRGLREEQHLVDLVEDGLAAEEQASVEEYDAILLDLMLPGLDGLEVCRRLRAVRVDTPILVTSARDEVADRVAALDAGADDYLVKPFDFDELLARLRALSRRGRTRHLSAVIACGRLELDPRDHTVRADGTPLDLTATEFRLLEYLLGRAESVVSRAQLADHVWGSAFDRTSNVIDVYIGYLRRKLAAAGLGDVIQTARGLGYMLTARPAPIAPHSGGVTAPGPAHRATS
jgi:DNA-binding response OmpR family regulator